MAIRKPMSAETKKKISDALKKGGGAEAVGTGEKRAVQSKESQALYNQFTTSKSQETQMSTDIASIRDSMKSMPKGKAGKAVKAAAKEKIKAIADKIKAEREKQKVLKQQAVQLKAVQRAKAQVDHANAVIAKAKQALAKSDLLEAKAKTIAAKLAASPAKKKKSSSTTTTDPKEKLQAALDRINAARQHQQDSIAKATKDIADSNKTIKSGGKMTNKAAFNFSEHNREEFCILLDEKKKFSIWRTLSLQEKRVDFQTLNDMFDEGEGDLEDELTAVVAAAMAASLIRMQNRIKAGDIAGIAAISMISANAINTVVNKYIKQSYEQGKSTAAKELKVPKPITPTLKTQLMNLDSSMIAEAMANEIDLAAKQKAKDGLAKGVATTAIIAAAANAAQDKASKMMAHVVGNVVGENLNKGRRLVFEDNAADIVGYQRSEILDGRTCQMCLSLDERTVKADDPMAQLDEVHDNCRGVWVPLWRGEEMPETVGLPASIVDSFETIGGAPTVNAFKQLKKPINGSNEAVQKEIKRRLNVTGLQRKFGHA